MSPPPTRTEFVVGILGILWIVAGSIWWAWPRIMEVMR